MRSKCLPSGARRTSTPQLHSHRMHAVGFHSAPPTMSPAMSSAMWSSPGCGCERGFGVEFINEFDELGRGLDAVLTVSGELRLDRCYSCIAVQPQALLDHGRGAEEVRLETEVDRHTSGGLLAVSAEPQVLNGADVVTEALAGERGVVEVLVLRTHGADRERVTGRVALGRLVDVVGELDRGRDDQVEVGQGPPGAGRADRERFHERIRVLGNERVTDPPVGELTGELQVSWSEGRDVDRYFDRSHHRSERLTGPVGKR